MFSGLTSRCTTPRPCAQSSAHAICVEDRQRPLERQLAANAEQAREVGVAQRRREIQQPFVVAVVPDGKDVRMRGALGGVGLALEARAELLVLGQVAPDELHGGRAVVAMVDRLVDAAHAALADLTDELEAAAYRVACTQDEATVAHVKTILLRRVGVSGNNRAIGRLLQRDVRVRQAPPGGRRGGACEQPVDARDLAREWVIALQRRRPRSARMRCRRGRASRPADAPARRSSVRYASALAIARAKPAGTRPVTRWTSRAAPTSGPSGASLRIGSRATRVSGSPRSALS